MKDRRRIWMWLLFFYTLGMSICCMFFLLRAYPLS